MSAEPVTTAVVKVDNTPGAMVRQHAESFTAVLPSHIKPDTWVRLAQSALKRGKKVKTPGGQVCTELELAAGNNPTMFLGSLLESARLGLEPGTEQYYLTPRKVGGRLEILGIVGYQGYIELMYRAGAISSVVAECVYSGQGPVPVPARRRTSVRVHEIDWDAEDRGLLRLVYAYAVMKDGATSKVVVLNKAAIKKIKKSSQGSNSQYSPWQKHHESMWLKSAVRQLAKWVPTSAEYMREQLRVAKEVAAERPGGFAPSVEATGGAPVDITDTWEPVDENVLDAELVEGDEDGSQ
jgi:recombination protein RecT